MTINVRPAHRLEELVNENGDIVYRPLYRSEIILIYKADIDRLLDGRPLNNTTVWEVLAAWEEERKSKPR